MASKDINDCVQVLRDLWAYCKPRFQESNPGYTCELSCTYRSPAEQKTLYGYGRTDKTRPIVTYKDGTKLMSMHNYNPSRAFDIVILKDGKATWDKDPYRQFFNIAADSPYASKVEWGGHWVTLDDYPHFQAV